MLSLPASEVPVQYVVPRDEKKGRWVLLVGWRGGGQDTVRRSGFSSTSGGRA